MKRDLDLIRRILLALEDEKPDSLTGENQELVSYHISAFAGCGVRTRDGDMGPRNQTAGIRRTTDHYERLRLP